MANQELVGPIEASQQPRRRWQVWVDGQELPGPALVELRSRFGLLRYGWTAGGYDGWTFREAGTGGVVTVPYATYAGTLFVGVVEQWRPNQGGQVWNVPRGFVELDEGKADAASRELMEETGLGAPTLVELPGAPLNPNSAFFETPGEEDGVRIYGLRIPEAWLEREGAALRVADAYLGSSQSAAERAEERIGKLRFLPWTEAARLADMFSVAAVGRLLAALETPA